MKNNNGKLSTLFSILFFGGLWGIVEASLGTVLHLISDVTFKTFVCSSTILLPIGWLLLTALYKRTKSIASISLAGVVAGLIKLSVALAIGFVDTVYKPAIFIVLEALVMTGAIAICRPTKVLSFRTMGAFVIANCVYLLSYLAVDTLLGGVNAFASLEAFSNKGVKYLVTYNALGLGYSLIVGLVAYLVCSIPSIKNSKFNLNKFVSSPIVASLAVVVAVALTITLKLVA